MILTINGGSSSIKFALFDAADTPQQLLYGSLENIGTDGTSFSFNDIVTKQKKSVYIKSANHQDAATFLIDWLEKRNEFDSVTAIGHRIVHGMQHTKPEVLTPGLLDELKKISAYDPEHLPEEIRLVELFTEHCPSLVQVACFDTSFHTTMTPVAKML
jgi:acetate kinase